MSIWAVIKTGGKQYKVSEGQTLDVEKVKPDSKGYVVFDQILAASREDGLELGKPTLANAKVRAKIIEEFKNKKIQVIKFKSKSRYLRKRGHRQVKTRILIEKILVPS